MGKLKGNTHTSVFRECAFAPAGFFGDEFEDANHAGGVEVAGEGIGFRVGVGNAREAEQVEPELHRIFSGGVGEFVYEGLEDPGESVAAWRAQRVGGNAERHEGGAERKVLQK